MAWAGEKTAPLSSRPMGSEALTVHPNAICR